MTIPPPPQTGRRPMMLSAEHEGRLLARRAEADRTDPFANDLNLSVRRLGKLAIRRDFEDPSDYFALGDLCAGLSVTNDRLLIFYVGKTLLAYQKAGQIARAGERPQDVYYQGHSNDGTLADKALENFITWVLDAARHAPTPRNIAVALWAITELPLERQTDQHHLIVINLAEQYITTTIGGGLPDPIGRPTVEMPNILSRPTPSRPDAADDEDEAVLDTQDDLEDTTPGEDTDHPDFPRSGGLESAPSAESLTASPQEFPVSPAKSSFSRQLPIVPSAADQDADDFRVDEVIFDPDSRRSRYEVRHILRGGMGIIYICYDRETRDRVALKTFQGRLLDNKKAIERFTHEALTWIRLDKHPHIVQARKVQTFGSERVRERPHIILEYIAGPEGLGSDLKSWIEKNQLDMATSVEIGLHICLGMQHAIRIMPGLVHRDLKPANILVRHDGLAKVTDFGLVRSVESRSGLSDIPDLGIDSGDLNRLTRAGAVVGTAPYMSPEQCMGLEVDLRSDIYAFGAILYEMLTGRRVFQARTPQEWLEAHVREIPEFPVSAARIPPPLRDLTLRCLEKDREFRPQSWGELAEELALVYEDITGMPPVVDYSGEEMEFREVMDKAYSLTELGYGDEALEIYDRALELAPREPDTAWVWARKGRTLRILERYEDAIGAQDKAVAIKPDFAWAWQQMAIVYERLNDFSMALHAYEQAAQKKPGDVWVVYNHARLYFQSGFPDKALERLDGALTVDPDHVSTHTLRGEVLTELNRLDEALDAFDRAIQIKPGYGAAWFGKGVLLRKQGRDAEAVSAFMQATRLQPGRIAPWLRLADTYNTLGRHEDALPVIQQAARIKPNYRGVWLRLGLTLRQLKRHDEAAKAYDQALAIDPACVPALVSQGEIFEQQGRFDEAIACFKQAADLGKPVFFLRIGRLYLRLERGEEALTAYTQATERDPELAWAWSGMGSALLKLRRFEDAVGALDRALALAPHNAFAWNTRGRALEKLSKMDEAIDSYERAADEAPGVPWYHLNMVEPLLELARREEALDACEEAIRLFAAGRPEARPSKLAPRSAAQSPGAPESEAANAAPEKLLAVLNAALSAAAATKPEPQGPAVPTAGGDTDAGEHIAIALMLKGRVLRRMNRHEEAIEVYDRVLAIDPHDFRAWNEKGAAFAVLGQREEALAAFIRAAEIAPSNVWAWYNQGEALVELGRYDDAIRALNRALEIDPTHKRSKLKRVEARRKLHR